MRLPNDAHANRSCPVNRSCGRGSTLALCCNDITGRATIKLPAITCNALRRAQPSSVNCKNCYRKARRPSLSASRIVQHLSHHCCAWLYIILWPGGSSVANGAGVFARKMSHVKAPCRAGRRVLDPIDAGWRVPPPRWRRAQLTVRRTLACQGFFGVARVAGAMMPCLNDPPQRRGPAG